MMRSLFAGVSGIRSHQVKMDVVGNNIANVNTVGFKGSRVTFQDLLSATVSSAVAPQGGSGGINPMQIGSGTKVGTIETLFTPGNTSSTGQFTDMAIEGDGFFVLRDGASRQVYTRAGGFTQDAQGNLVDGASGFRVMGWKAGADGRVDTNQPLVPLRIPKGDSLPPRPTSNIRYSGNLQRDIQAELNFTGNPMIMGHGDETARVSFTFEPTGNFNEWRWVATPTAGELVPAGDYVGGILTLDHLGNVSGVSVDGVPGATGFSLTAGGAEYDISLPAAGTRPAFAAMQGGVEVSVMEGTFDAAPDQVTVIEVFDSQGGVHELIMRFTKVDDNNWTFHASSSGMEPLSDATGKITFDTNGRIRTVEYDGSFRGLKFRPVGGTEEVTLNLNFESLTQFSSGTSLEREQDGYPVGIFSSFTVDSLGIITGVYTNGLNQPIGRLALANFANSSGLLKMGGTLFGESANSGTAQIGTTLTGGRGRIMPASLEMSNVDLSNEFTEMIITQRGFQANSRIITTTDEMLQEVVNLRR